MTDKKKTSPKVDAEATAPEPRYAPHVDEGMTYDPGQNPMGIRRGPAHPFDNPPAYTGQGAPAEAPSASVVADYARGDVSVAPTTEEAAANREQNARVTGTGQPAGQNETSAGPATAVNASAAVPNASTPATTGNP